MILHIILLILKIIGVILLSLLGLLIFILLLALFVPFRYKVKLGCHDNPKNIQGIVKFSWLLHLFRGQAVINGTQVDTKIMIAWKRFGKTTGGDSHTGGDSNDGSGYDEAGNDGGGDRLSESLPENAVEPLPEVTLDSAIVDLPKPDSEKKSGISEETTGENAGKGFSEETRAVAGKGFNKKTQAGAGEKTGEESEDTKTKGIKGIIEKIQYTVQKIYDKIVLLLGKKDTIMAFVKADVHQLALKKLLKELKKLLRILIPRKIRADVRFGFEDPGVTGYVLAGVSVVYPFIRKNAIIEPDFQNEVLDGNLIVKGKIRSIHLLVFAVKLLLNRNVRRTIRDVRNFKF